MPLKLTRPIACFDLESTGAKATEDRITEICIVKLDPDGTITKKTRRVNPTIPVSPEAAEITGLTNEILKDEPTFKQLAKGIHSFLEGCDLAGYNIKRFDVPMLEEEFKRAGIIWDIDDISMVDGYSIFCSQEPRTLEAALKYYCNETLEGAHAAENDVLATLKVIQAQIDHYEAIPESPEEIHEMMLNPRWVDRQGKLVWSQGNATIGFGKHQGRTLQDMVENDKGYLEWMMKSFPSDTCKILFEAINGNFPVQAEEATTDNKDDEKKDK